MSDEPTLERLSLIELRSALHERRLSPVEVARATLARIDATHADLNAIVALRERTEILADARVAEERIVRGEARPLEGIPLGVKDLEDAAGLVTSHGSLVFRDAIAVADNAQVARLRAAGAIPFGKTNTPEFGFTAITKNLLFGVTRSPWNLERTPGGSSGGSAAAVTAGVLPLVTASDGGGSIRIPASFTGAFGLKPSFGRIPRGPQSFWSHVDTTCAGPLTRTVEDAALFLDVTAGSSPHDPNSLPHPGISYLETLQAPFAEPLRIGFSADLGYAVVQSDVASTVEDAACALEAMGHRLERLRGGPPNLGTDWARLDCFEQAATLHPFLPEKEASFQRSFLRGVKSGWKMTPERWGGAARGRAALNRWCGETFERFDILITPTVPYDPPPASGPFPAQTEGREQVPFGVASFTIPFNLSWHPAATVRAGLSRAGLPIGMQIVGPRHRDDLVLRVARAFERERPWHPNWPIRW